MSHFKLLENYTNSISLLDAMKEEKNIPLVITKLSKTPLNVQQINEYFHLSTSVGHTMTSFPTNK